MFPAETAAAAAAAAVAAAAVAAVAAAAVRCPRPASWFASTAAGKYVRSNCRQ